MAALTVLLTIATFLVGLTTAQSCAANTTCPTGYPNGLLLLKSACPGPNITTQQFNPGECINTTTLYGNESATPSMIGINSFKATFIDGADFHIPEMVLYPAASCNASASTAKTWSVTFGNRDRYDRKATACHSFKVGGVVPGSVRFRIRALARPRR